MQYNDSDNIFTSNTDYLNELNPVQRLAVETTDGPVMIIAGPGSGKTRVLTYRIAHLINKGVKPYHILALTFTNKAAREMKARMTPIVGERAAGQIWMGTFHSIFAKILRIEAKHLGYPSDFTIYDTDDSKNLIKTIIAEQNLNSDLYKANAIKNRISNAKSNLIMSAAYLKHDGIRLADAKSKLPKIGEIYRIYEQRCRRAGAMDFDDLLILMYALLLKSEEVRKKYQDRFKYVMIDEFQDTNKAQYAIVKLLAAHRNIAVVGDDAQSIYAFRGATIHNILTYEKDFPKLEVFKLEQNYRSTKKIVALANDIIASNRNQITKKIWTSNDIGNQVVLFRAASDSEEAKFVADRIFVERLRNHHRNDEFAILYRTNAQSRVLEEALRKKNIPYRIYGGLSFYQRKEIKDMMAYLRLTVNHNDEEALRRVLNVPTRGIGATSLKKLAALANQQQTSLFNIMKQIGQLAFPTRTKNAIAQFVRMIELFASMQKKKDAHELAVYIGKTSGITKMLHADKSVEGMGRNENLQELFNSIQEFVDNKRELATEGLEIDATLGVYLQEVSLLTDMDKDDEEDTEGKVKLMTVHSAKGLEFSCVHIVGLEEGLFPSGMSKQPKEIEEERRLFYVAVTRAEKKLFLSLSACRYRFGKLQYGEPSRFVGELNERHFKVEGQKQSYHNADRENSTYNSFKDSIKDNINAVKRRQQQQKNLGKDYSKLLANFKANDPRSIREDMTVLHQRFGRGKVQSLDGKGDKTIAIIQFDVQGEKRILLRFAKLMVVE